MPISCRILLPLLLLACTVQAQYPTDYFRSPLGIDLSTSAPFGEVRRNHFHSGLDLRTNSESGYRVYAAADGYVSRIKVSPWGGGKIIYIDHPNGYRSVYMHLLRMDGAIGLWVRRFQYANRTFAFDTNVAPGVLPVKKGQVIALSGNSGSSGGPHLHFELRHAHNDQTINAQLFGINVPDGVAPTIKGIRIYPASASASINGGNEGVELLAAEPVRKSKRGKKKRSPAPKTAVVRGPFYLGVYAIDQSESYHGKSGVFRFDISIDGSKVFNFKQETFRFEDTRSVNALMDYPLYCSTYHPYILTRQLPYAPVTASHPVSGNGIFSLKPGTHTITVDAYDNQNNHTRTQVTIRCEGNVSQAQNQRKGVVRRHKQNFGDSRYRISVPREALYSDDSVRCTYNKGVLSIYPTQQFGERFPIPPHVDYTVRIAVSEARNVRRAFNRQLMIARRTDRKVTPLATSLQGGWLVAHPRDFGEFVIVSDTTPPTIKPSKHMVASPGGTLTVRISDNLAGIDTYNCYLNDRWILADYDGKNGTLSIDLPSAMFDDNVMPYLHPATNTLRVDLSDMAGNTTSKVIPLE